MPRPNSRSGALQSWDSPRCRLALLLSRDVHGYTVGYIMFNQSGARDSTKEYAMSVGAPIRGSRREGSARYDAFISYAHEDRPVAAGIQKGLHRVGRRVGQLHALRVFRDDTDLTAAPDLWGRVTEAMGQSRYMVVVLSPRALESRWVNKEVAYWLERRGSVALLLVLADGQIRWDEENRHFHPELSDALPEALTRPGTFMAEPLYVDVSSDGPWDLDSASFRDKVATLAAPIHGKSKYELASDDVREQRRFRRLRRAALIGLVGLSVAALVSAVFALDQRQEALDQRQQAREQEREAIRQRDAAVSVGLASASLRVAESNGAVALALAAESVAASQAKSHHAMDALISARQVFASRGWHPRGDPLAAHSSPVWTVAFNPVGDLMASAGDGTVRLWDPTTGTQIGQPLTGHEDSVNSVAFSPNGDLLASASEDGTVRLWDPATGTQIGRALSGHNMDVESVAFSPDGTNSHRPAGRDGAAVGSEVPDPGRAAPNRSHA